MRAWLLGLMAAMLLGAGIVGVTGAQDDAGSYGYTEGLSQAAYRYWVGGANLDRTAISAGAFVLVFETDEDAARETAIGLQDIVPIAEEDLIGDVEIVEIDLDAATDEAYRVSSRGEERGFPTAGVAVIARQGSTVLAVSAYVIETREDEHPEALLADISSDVETFLTGMLNATAGDSLPSDEYGTWSGGIWDRFPPADGFSIGGVEIDHEDDDMVIADPDLSREVTVEAENEDATQEAERQAREDATMAAEATQEAEATAGADAMVASAPGGLIAYVGPDTNIWTMEPDGSNQQQITTDGDYSQPVWSHDGTMLAFLGPLPEFDYTDGIVILRDGRLIGVEDSTGCERPVFAADNTRLLYSCNAYATRFVIDRSAGLVSSSNIDGGDRREEIPLPESEEFRVLSLDVRASDGAVLLVYEVDEIRELITTTAIYDASFNLINANALGTHPITNARFTASGNGVVGGMCWENCRGSGDPLVPTLLSFDGEPRMLAIPDVTMGFGPNAWISLAPNETHFVWANSGFESVVTMSTIDGTAFVPIAPGSQPAWQPDPVEGAGSGQAPAIPTQAPPTPTPTSTPSPTATPTPTPTATPEPSPTPTPTATPEPSPTPFPTPTPVPTEEPAAGGTDGWIAYIGDDRNVWVMRPDGSEATRITDNAQDIQFYSNPVWSHDGTMLAFESNNDEGHAGPLMIARGGEITILRDTSGCRLPAFSADNSRLFYTCWAVNTRMSPLPGGNVLPQEGFLSSSAIDGSDQVNHIGYPTVYTDGSNGYGVLRALDVRSSDGALLLVTENEAADGSISFLAETYDAGLTLAGSFDLGMATGVAANGPFVTMFAPVGDQIAIAACVDRCLGLPSGVVLLGLAGIDGQGYAATEYFLPVQTGFGGIDSGPDGESWVLVFDRRTSDVSEIGLATGESPWIPIGTGTDPAWQPVPAEMP